MKKILSSLNNSLKKINFKFLFIVLAISIFALYPYYNDMLIYSHDLGYHLNRINEIANNLNIGVFPSYIHSGLLNGLGYANSLFYPELFIYIPALMMSLFGLMVLPSYKIFLVIITFFTFVSMYLSAKKIFNSKYVGWLAALIYVFSLYRLTNIFVRGAVRRIIRSYIFPNINFRII